MTPEERKHYEATRVDQSKELMEAMGLEVESVDQDGTVRSKPVSRLSRRPAAKHR
jgi:hypothetical protein